MADVPAAAPAPQALTPANSTPSQSPSSDASARSGSSASPGSTTPGGAEPSQQQTAPEYFEVKVNGKTVKMTRQEALDRASMSYAANEKFNEASQIRKKVDGILARAKSNPIDALMDPSLGLTKDEVRAAFEKWYMQEYVEPESLNEDQKKLRETEKRLQKYQEQEAEAAKKAQAEEESTLTAQAREHLQKQIIEAMDKSGLPKTKRFVEKMAFYMRRNLINGWEAPMDLIISQVKNDFSQDISHLTEDASVEQLLSLFGEGVINKIRQHDLKQLRERRNMPHSSVNTNSSQAGTGPIPNGKIDSVEVTRRIRDMRTGKLSF